MRPDRAPDDYQAPPVVEHHHHHGAANGKLNNIILAICATSCTLIIGIAGWFGTLVYRKVDEVNDKQVVIVERLTRVETKVDVALNKER